jgi:uncharacterized Zn-finger protein
MKSVKRSLASVLGFSSIVLKKTLLLSLGVILFCPFFFNLTYAEVEDTVYIEPAAGTRLSANGDTIYIQPTGEDFKIKVNLKNHTDVAGFYCPMMDKYYAHDRVFLDSVKNNHSLIPRCFEGSRVPEEWGAQILRFYNYPPHLLVGAIAVTADPLPPGDGPLFTLTFTAIDSATIYVDTCAYVPSLEVLQLMDPYGGPAISPHFTPRIFNVVICPYTPGDLNWDQIVDLLDLPLLIYYLFRDWDAPCPLKAADVNCDQDVGLVDVVYLINYIFRSGPAPQTCEY